VRPTTDRIDGIDATLILGQDFATFVAAEAATSAAASTTVTTVATTTTT
jgi:hypothetical protein